MSKNLSAKYYHVKKVRLQNELVKDIKVFLKKKKKKNATTSSRKIQILVEDEKKSWSSIEKKYYKLR